MTHAIGNGEARVRLIIDRASSNVRIAMRARDLVDQGTAIDAACRIVILEDQLEEALRINEQLRAGHPGHQPPAADT